MDPELRKALKNVQGAFEEGFMSKSEYELRRKALLDGATTFSTPPDQETGSGPTKEGTAGSGSGKVSVFDRLEYKGAKAAGAPGKWDHGGFEQLYGKSGKQQTGPVRTIAKKGVAKPGTLRFSTEIYRPPKGDLRSKLEEKAAQKSASGKRGSLPEKCPW